MRERQLSTDRLRVGHALRVLLLPADRPVGELLQDRPALRRRQSVEGLPSLPGELVGASLRVADRARLVQGRRDPPLHSRPAGREIRSKGLGIDRRQFVQAVDQRQRQLPLLEVGAERLAGRRLVAGQVEQVVGHLERQPQVAAVGRQPVRDRVPGPGVQRPESAAALGQGRRLAVDHGEVVGLGQVQVPPLAHLPQFPRADPVGRLADHPAGPAVHRAGQVEGVREQRVPEAGRRPCSPTRRSPSGRAAARPPRRARRRGRASRCGSSRRPRPACGGPAPHCRTPSRSSSNRAGRSRLPR